jgi:hypothetical protein
MSTPVTWIRFWTALLPEMITLGRHLYRLCKGDVDAARREIHAIRDHGARLEAFEKEAAQRLAAIKAREKEPD